MTSSNDGFDAATGVDKNKAESVVNLTGGKAGPVLLASLGFLAGGALLLHRGISNAVGSGFLVSLPHLLLFPGGQAVFSWSLEFLVGGASLLHRGISNAVGFVVFFLSLTLPSLSAGQARSFWSL